jgi:hypothetical protein
MKKRPFTTMLLIWLFSQQLFAVVWAMPLPGMNYADNNQSHCTLEAAPKYMDHIMPMMQRADDTNDSAKKLSMMCKHCSTVCQASLISDNLLPLVTSGHLPYEAQFINTPVDGFISTLYRPPIFA